MKRFIFSLLILSLFSHQLLMAQTTEQISMGAAYNNQTFYKLSDGSSSSSSHSSWQIAFSCLGSTDAGVFINETAALGANPVKLYATSITDFNTTIDTSMITMTELGNAEESWSYGAFNENREASDPFDYGWGTYSMITHSLSGSKVYLLDLPSIGLKKMTIDSMVNGSYYFRYADLDGSNLETQSVAKSNFPNSQLAYFSFSTNTTVANVEPADWDLLFTGYQTSIPDGSGGFMNYGVRAILTADGVEVAQTDGVDPSTVNENNYLDSLSSTKLDIIGYDWKDYDFSAGWSITPNQVFFVKTTDNRLWKIQFLDFGGSTNGTTTFQKTDLGLISNTNLLESNKTASLKSFPNPSRGQFSLLLDLPEDNMELQLELLDPLGRLIYQQTYTPLNSLEQIQIPNLNLPAGQYTIRATGKNILLLDRIVIY